MPSTIPAVETAAMAARCFSPKSRESPAQVSVVFLEPVLADGAEDVEVERVFERHGAVRHVRGNAQDLPFSDHDHAATLKSISASMAPTLADGRVEMIV